MRGTIFVAVLAFIPVESRGESLTLETYYPSPVGIYTNVTVTSGTVLAKDGGDVSAGNAAKKSVIRLNGVVVPGKYAADPVMPAQKIEGAIYYNTTTKAHRTYKNNAWTNLGCSAFSSGYKNVTGSRGYGTTYTNKRPDPIFVTVTGESTSVLFQKFISAYVEGVRIQTVPVTDANYSAGWANSANSLTFIVPPGQRYRVERTHPYTKLVSWMELY